MACDLKRLYDDVIDAKKRYAINNAQAENYFEKYSTLARRLNPQKKELKKQEDSLKSKRSLNNLHKTNLPDLKDTLDCGPWRTQVEHMARALKEEENDDPLLKQRIINRVKTSLKGAVGQLK